MRVRYGSTEYGGTYVHLKRFATAVKRSVAETSSYLSGVLIMRLCYQLFLVPCTSLTLSPSPTSSVVPVPQRYFVPPPPSLASDSQDTFVLPVKSVGQLLRYPPLCSYLTSVAPSYFHASFA